MPVLSSVALGGWIIDESLVKKTSPISEYISLLAMVIGTSKSLFKTVLIFLSVDPVAFKILFNFLVDLPSLAKFFKELIIFENTKNLHYVDKVEDSERYALSFWYYSVE